MHIFIVRLVNSDKHFNYKTEISSNMRIVSIQGKILTWLPAERI